MPEAEKNDGWACKGNSYFEAFYKGLGIVPENEWEDFMLAAKSPLPVSFRITGFRSEAKAMLGIIEEEYLSKFEIENKASEMEKSEVCDFIRLPWYPDNLAFQLQMDRRTIRRTPAYQRFHEMLVSETESGGISRQETVSMIPPILLDVKPYHKVIDMCAAPGSKTAQILEMLHADESTAGLVMAKSRGFVVANDSDAKRCQLLVHQLQRLQSPLLCVTCHDAASYPSLKMEDNEILSFDRVLCDVPCSGDGTVRKNPMIWKRWSLTSGTALNKLQNRILRRGLEMLRSDGAGRLVYSTCSLNPAENEAVVASILIAGGKSLNVVDISTKLPGLKTREGLTDWSYVTQDGVVMKNADDVPPPLKKSFHPAVFCPENLSEDIKIQLRRCIRILPHDNNTGGFFVAVFEKNGKLDWQKVAHPLALATPTGNEEAGKVKADTSDECQDAKKPKLDSEVQVQKPQVPHKQGNKKTHHYMNEAPLIWLTEDHEDWKQIKGFFNLKSTGDDGTFIPPYCLCSRTEGSRRRIFFLASPNIRALITNNDRLRPICVGVRCFARSHSANSPCDFRICQDCVYVVGPYIKSRLIELSSKKEAVTLLTKENPFTNRLGSAVVKQMENIDVGTCVFRLQTKVNEETEDNFEILMAGWHGKATSRIFVAKYERSHFLRLCGIHAKDRNGKFNNDESVEKEGCTDNENENAVDCESEKESVVEPGRESLEDNA